MKKYLIVLFGLFFLNSFAQNEYERYNVKTGKVVYQTDENKATIIKTILFKDWGATELIVEEKTEYTNKKKNQVAEKTTQIMKLDRGFIYTVVERDKQIYQAKNYYLVLQRKKNLADHGKVIAEDFGGTKIGQETYLGFRCDIWRVKGQSITNYKGVPLVTESRLESEKAIEAAFDIEIDETDFNLPDYPIVDINPFAPVEETIDYFNTEEGQQEAKDAWENVKDMTWEEWYYLNNDNDEFEGMTKEEIKEAWDRRKSNAVDERIEDRKQDHLKNVPHWPTW